MLANWASRPFHLRGVPQILAAPRLVDVLHHKARMFLEHPQTLAGAIEVGTATTDAV